MGEAADLSAHISLMQWDTAFAWTKGLTYYALLYMLTEGAEWPAYTIPIHATIDTLENIITIIAVSGFK